MKAIRVTTDDTVEELTFTNETAYETLRNGVDGWIEPVTLGGGLTLWVNEEGKLLGLPHNRYAQAAWDEVYGSGTDYIVGNAVFTGGTDDDGETLGLTDEDEQKVRNFIALATV